MRAVATLLIVAAASAAPATSKATDAVVFRDTAGRLHAVTATPARAVVLFFITPDCPVSQGYVPEMNRIQQVYAPRGVAVFAVQGDSVYSEADFRRHAAEYAYRFPVLLDPRQDLVRHTNARVTPEAVVLSPQGRVLYQGRIDDRIVSLGTRRQQATSLDLRNALDDVLAGRPVRQPKTLAFGCFITRRAR
jgi:hypothetical protein